MDDPIDSYLSGPDEAKRDQIRHDLISRARTIQRYGWADYRYVWPSGYVAGVAYLLQDDAVMREMGETEATVLSRYAYDLYGIRGGDRERAAEWADTHAWFDTARAELHR
jgi:hypothetical protein